MVDIVPLALSDARDLLGPELPVEFAGTAAAAVPEPCPFVQLGYDEIDGEEIDVLLGYAGIPKANGPVGLPGEFTPFSTSGGWLLFPLEGLSTHLHSVAGEVATAYEKSGSFEAYAEAVEELTAREYLIAGTLETLRFCKEHRLALQIRW